jgi:hypothetical protein
MKLKVYYGILISRRSNIGTKSEGPEYYINLEETNEFGQTELFVRKKAHLWQADSVLHKYIGKKVKLKGEPIYSKHVKFEGKIKSEGIIYKEIEIID